MSENLMDSLIREIKTGEVATLEEWDAKSFSDLGLGGKAEGLSPNLIAELRNIVAKYQALAQNLPESQEEETQAKQELVKKLEEIRKRYGNKVESETRSSKKPRPLDLINAAMTGNSDNATQVMPESLFGRKRMQEERETKAAELAKKAQDFTYNPDLDQPQ